MAVHLIQVKCETKPNITEQDLRTACETWAASYTEALSAYRLTIQRAYEPDIDVPAHYYGAWRFSWGGDYVAMINALETAISPRVSWARIDYHACTLDEDPTVRLGCTWDDARIIGTPPPGV